MTATLFLVRHGETEFNTRGIYQGQLDSRRQPEQHLVDQLPLHVRMLRHPPKIELLAWIGLQIVQLPLSLADVVHEFVRRTAHHDLEIVLVIHKVPGCGLPPPLR